MPQITVSVTTSEESSADDTLSYDLSLDLTILDLKSFVEAETGHPPSRQTFFFNGRPLTSDTQTLDQSGIKDGDMLALLVSSEAQPAPRQRRAPQTNPSDGPSPHESETLRQRLLNDTNARAQVSREYPDIAAALDDRTRFHEAYSAMARETVQRRAAQQAELERLNDDPFNPDNQQKIAEIIRKENVEKEQLETMQQNPEFFAKVTMLYINVEVNGHPVKAFVDSGAQATIMSPSCAEACNITRLVDERYAGIAHGVGTARILGRVHRALIKIGDAELPCAFTVMEGKDVDMLLGLDMLRRYQACIDLAQNQLRFAGGVAVPFLPESEIPKFAERAMDAEPTVEGPDGTTIGAVSGAVKPASSSAVASTSAAGPSSASAGGSHFRGQGHTLRSNPQPASAPPAAAAAPAAAASPFPEAAIAQLQSMGYSRNEVIEALRACDGNVEYAASLLFER